MKRLLAALLCLAMMVGCMSACSKTPKKDGSQSGSQAGVSGEEQSTAGTDENGSAMEESGSGEATSGQESNGSTTGNGGNAGTNSNKGTTVNQANVKVVNNCYTSGTKIAKNKVTLKVMVRDYTGGVTNYNTCALTKYIENTMNVKLEFTTCSATEVSTKITLAYTGGNAPDIFMGMAPAAGVHDPYIKQGKVRELGQYINTFGPNIKKLFSKYPQAKYITTFDDGKTYMLPMVQDNKNYSDQLFINTKWLKNVGASMPTTMEQLEAVLKKFKDQDPNKNGKKDEVPMALVGDIPPSLFGPFGISTYHNWFHINQSTNKIEYSPISDSYKQGMKYFVNLYKNQLLYNGFRGLTKQGLKEMTSGSVPTVGVFATDSLSDCVDPKVFLDQYSLMPPLKSSTTKNSTWADVEYENTWAEWFVVTKNCKYPEIAVRLADWFYTEEGTLSVLYGPRGKKNFWDYGSNGQIEFYKKNIPSGKTTTEYLYSMTPSYCLPRCNSQALSDKISAAKSDITTTQDKMSSALKAQNNAMYKNTINVKYKYPHLSYTQADNAKLSDLGDYGQYVYEMRWKFMGGTASLDNDWDNYVAQVKKLGVNTSLQVQQQAYNRYRVFLKNNS